MILLILNFSHFHEYDHSFVKPRMVNCVSVEDIIQICDGQEICSACTMYEEKGLFRPDNSNGLFTHDKLWDNLQNNVPVHISWHKAGPLQTIWTTEIFPVKLNLTL